LNDSFNMEGVHCYTGKIKTILSALKEKNVGLIIDNNNFVGGTPDAFDEMEVFNSWLCKKTLKAKAIIIKSQVNKQIILHRNPSLSLQNVSFFTNFQEAHAWVKKCL
ncbi:MAG: hypothetical protein V5786_05565, partial [Psychromonas sp.]